MENTIINHEKLSEPQVFSIIITVFNASEMYLRECIGSVIAQEYSNVEIIIVNDGSNNSDTLAVLSEYGSTSDYDGKTLIVFHKENGGQGSARNAGLKIASGDYILFLDSDDYYTEPSFLSDISKLLDESKADVLSFQYVEFFDENLKPETCVGDLPREKVFNQPTNVALKAMLSAPRSVFSAATHTKAIKAKLTQLNNITALEGISNEDITLTANIIFHAKTYDRYNKTIYAYRRTNISSISARDDNSIIIARDILRQFQLLLSNEDYRNNKNILDFLASPYMYMLGKLVSASHSADNSKKAGIKTDIKAAAKYSYILKHSSRKHVLIAGMMIRIFGIRFTMFLMRIFLTLNKKHMLSLNRKIQHASGDL